MIWRETEKSVGESEIGIEKEIVGIADAQDPEVGLGNDAEVVEGIDQDPETGIEVLDLTEDQGQEKGGEGHDLIQERKGDDLDLEAAESVNIPMGAPNRKMIEVNHLHSLFI